MDLVGMNVPVDMAYAVCMVGAEMVDRELAYIELVYRGLYALHLPLRQ